jgi:hypothetical protein
MAAMGLIHSRTLKKQDKAQARLADEQRKRMSARKRMLVGSASVLVTGGAGAVFAPATPACARYHTCGGFSGQPGHADTCASVAA